MGSLGESLNLELSESFVHVAKYQMFAMIMTKGLEIKTFLYFFILLALYIWQCQVIVHSTTLLQFPFKITSDWLTKSREQFY